VRLCGIDAITGDLMAAAYSVPLTVEFLKGQPSLVVDTAHFSTEFKSNLLELVDDLSRDLDGLLLNSENLHALHLIESRYSGALRCLYIDPPYNTGEDGFVYKDAYLH
jgi:adenine-specific DNA-methyltransferase